MIQLVFLEKAGQFMNRNKRRKSEMRRANNEAGIKRCFLCKEEWNWRDLYVFDKRDPFYICEDCVDRIVWERIDVIKKLDQLLLVKEKNYE